MKKRIPFLMSVALAASAWTTVAVGAEKGRSPGPPEPRNDKRDLRVLSGPERERRVIVSRGERPESEKETVAFLGVETGPVSAAVSTQLGLQRGTGLVVNHLVPESPAAGALQQHDILLKFEDQILIETRQLAVLIRGKKEGDEVTLTYLRGGKQATVKITLGKHEVPKLSHHVESMPGAFAFGPGAERFERFVPAEGAEREEVDRVLSLLKRGPGVPDGRPGFVPSAPRIHVERGGAPGVRAMSVNTRNSNIVYSDDEGVLDLTIKEGVKTLVAKDGEGRELYSGPVSTPAERQALPAGVRGRLEKLEGMQDVTFRTDGDMRFESRMPRPRGISFPLRGTVQSVEPEVVPLPRRGPATF